MVPTSLEHGGVARAGAAESDEEAESSSEDDDDDEAYVTSNDHAPTPERRIVRAQSAGPTSWKGKGKAVAGPVSRAGAASTDDKDAAFEAFQDAADGEDLYGD